MISNIKVVALDCDGVMFDSWEANRAFYDAILKHFDKPGQTEEQLAYTHSHTVFESVEFLFPDRKIYDAAIEYKDKLSYAPFIGYLTIEPNLKKVLNGLRPTYRTAIATNRTNTMSALLAANDLTELFDFVVTAFDVAKPKPHPDQLNLIMEHFQVSADEILYVGDSGVDEEAAESTGVIFAAFGNSKLKADYHINSLAEINTILGIA